MAKTNQDAFSRLEGIADYFLLHDREIYQRADDSVAKIVDGDPIFLRRSRGYVPMPLSLPFTSEVTVAAVGPEEASTAAVMKGDKCYLSQHLGDIESPEAVSFLRGALGHILKLTRAGTPDGIALDMHPTFLSRNVAAELAEESGASLVEVQHHHAHLASVMADAGVEAGEEIVGIICDGYGYGLDGAPWGGEILIGGYGDFRRAGYLEPQPMPGGDLSALRYGRMLQGVLYGEVSEERLRSLLLERCMGGFVGGEREMDLVFEQIEKGINTPMTTSAGRLLDAVSCLLGVSYRRTFEGEGAIKLEAAAINGGKASLELPVSIEMQGGTRVLRTSGMVRTLIDNLGEHNRGDLAYAFQEALAEGLAEMAVDVAEEGGFETVGFSGGVANNDMITQVIRKTVEARGMRFLRHKRVPAGDGGLSLGQAAVASAKPS
jgi:hydrogenase maturation protein HypF